MDATSHSCTVGCSVSMWHGQIYNLVYSAQPFQFVPSEISRMPLVFQVFLCNLDYINYKWKIHLRRLFQPIGNVKLSSLVNHLTI